MSPCIISIAERGKPTKYLPPLWLYRRRAPWFTTERALSYEFDSWQEASQAVAKLNAIGICGRINIEKL